MMPPLLSDILLDSDTISRRVRELGELISRELRHADLCIVPVLDGGMIFAADLARAISLPLVIKPVKASSYGNATSSSGSVTLPWGLPPEIEEKDLLLVDDILDTGNTLKALRGQLLEAGARSVRSCVLLRKNASEKSLAEYVGFDIPDKFVVGYGLDLAGSHRNLPDIFVCGDLPGGI